MILSRLHIPSIVLLASYCFAVNRNYTQRCQCLEIPLSTPATATTLKHWSRPTTIPMVEAWVQPRPSADFLTASSCRICSLSGLVSRILCHRSCPLIFQIMMPLLECALPRPPLVFDDATAAFSLSISMSKQVVTFKSYLNRLQRVAWQKKATDAIHSAIILIGTGNNDTLLEQINLAHNKSWVLRFYSSEGHRQQSENFYAL